MNQVWVVIAGDIFDGLQHEAETYCESHNLGHFTKAVWQLEKPRPSK